MNTTSSKSGMTSLSHRESEILLLISHEFTTSEIASKLFISSCTVESHRRNLLLKLQARNVAGMMRRAFENGILF